MWGCYLSGMWIHRLGLAKAKEHALTGKPLSGVEAAAAGLINRAVPFEELEREVTARRFIEMAAREGVAAATAERDGPFGDYSQAPEDRKPSRDHVIEPG
jgi:enoyl-CoA hydratase